MKIVDFPDLVSLSDKSLIIVILSLGLMSVSNGRKLEYWISFPFKNNRLSTSLPFLPSPSRNGWINFHFVVKEHSFDQKEAPSSFFKY